MYVYIYETMQHKKMAIDHVLVNLLTTDEKFPHNFRYVLIHGAVVVGTRAPSQYKDRLIYVW